MVLVRLKGGKRQGVGLQGRLTLTLIGWQGVGLQGCEGGGQPAWNQFVNPIEHDHLSCAPPYSLAAKIEPQIPQKQIPLGERIDKSKTQMRSTLEEYAKPV